tara:strand:- start:2417 stop:2560 length:144 start_codon:yes stop_codon:yes gene_type:complete
MDIEANLIGGVGKWETLSLGEKTSWIAYWRIDRKSRRLYPFDEVTHG